MATAIEEDKRAKRTGPAGFAPGVDVAAPLNLTAPGTMRPDAPTPVATQPAPQFTRTNAGPMLQTPAAPAPIAPAAPDPTQQRLANQTAMYVQGAQAAAAARPAPALVAAGMNPAVGAQAVDPMAGQAAFVPPRMGMRPPTVAMPAAPAAPLREGDPGWRTQAVMDGAAQDAQAAWGRGEVGQTAGALVRGAATAIPAAVMDFGEQTIAPIAGAAKGFWRGLTGSSDASQAAAQTTPIAPAIAPSQGKASTTTAPASTGDALRATGDYDRTRVATPPAPPAPPAAPANDFKEVAPGIYRRGNTFTDQAGTQDAAFLNRGAITPQNMQAADNLAANYNSNQQALARLQANNATTQAQGFQPQQARQFDRAASIKAMTDLTSPEYRALRALRMEAESEAKDNARLGRAGRGNNAAGQAYAALMAELTGGTRQGQVAEMQDATNRYTADTREAGATQRALMGEEGATRRAGMTNEVQQGELGLKREAQSLTSQAAQRLQKAQDDFLNETDPAKREAKARTLQALMGKGDGAPAGKDRYITMGGGQEFDLDAKAVVNRPQQLFDTVTGQRVGAAPAPAAQVPPAAIDMLKKNPGMAAQFDQKFGPGASARYLNQ